MALPRYQYCRESPNLVCSILRGSVSKIWFNFLFESLEFLSGIFWTYLAWVCLVYSSKVQILVRSALRNLVPGIWPNFLFGGTNLVFSELLTSFGINSLDTELPGPKCLSVSFYSNPLTDYWSLMKRLSSRVYPRYVLNEEKFIRQFLSNQTILEILVKFPINQLIIDQWRNDSIHMSSILKMYTIKMHVYAKI